MPTLNEDERTPDWTKTAVAIVIGLASVVSAVFTWRSASLGAEATFEDRAASTQEVLNQRLEAAIDLRMRRIDEGHVAFLGLKTLLSGFDQLIESNQNDSGSIATEVREGRRRVEEAAREVATSAAVFGEDPDLFRFDADFDREARQREVRIEAQNRPGAPVLGDPDLSAERADALRARALALTRWTVALVAVIVVLTVAEVTRRRRLRIALGALGSLGVATITLAVVAGGFT